MKNIIIETSFYQELKENIDTNLIFSDIEIMEYYQQENLEFLKIELPFTTTGNILTYQYNPQTDELLLIDAIVYSMNHTSNKEAYIDKETIMKLYQYCRQKTTKTIEATEKNLTDNTKETSSIENFKIEQLYNMIINEIPLTNESMLKNGFTEEDVNLLLKTGILKLTKSNEYTLSSVEKFYRYGIKLLLTKSVKLANTCFEKCYQIEPTHRDSCLQIFYHYLRLNEYDSALEMFSHIENISSKEYQPDNNLYLYLLSKLTILPEEYQKRTLHMKVSSVLPKKEYPYHFKEKELELRTSIFRNKYKYALNLLNDILATEGRYIASQTLLKELLLQAISVEEKFRARILHFAKTKRYGLIILFFDNKIKRRKLYQTEKSIYLITKEILEITRTKTVLPPIKTSNNSMYEAVENRSYEEARQLNRQFLEEHYFPLEDDIVNILLSDLNNLITRITEEETFEIFSMPSEEAPEILSYDSTIKSAEEIAYYLNAERILLEKATSILSLSEEQILLIKLVYARDYYIEGRYPKGDLLVYEVENNPNKTNQVLMFLDEVKTNRESYKDIISPHTRKKANLPSGNSY